MQKDLLGPELNPAMVKAIAKVAEEYLGVAHAVTKAFGAALTSSDNRKMIEMARARCSEPCRPASRTASGLPRRAAWRAPAGAASP